MYRATKFLLRAFLVLAATACGHNQQKESAAETVTVSMHERVGSYWNSIDTDSIDSDDLEQHIVDYIYILSHADSIDRAEGWRRISAALHRGYPDKTVVDYLGQPDSPLYSPDLLDEYLSTLADMLPTDDVARMSVEWLLENTRKNRPGNIIADIHLELADGRPSTLHRLVTVSSVVIFYDPECDLCAEIIEEYTANPPADRRIIAVSTEERFRTVPLHWISARVKDSEELHEAFYLPSLPIIYSVDSEGRIESVSTPV